MIGAVAWLLVGALAGVILALYLVDGALHPACPTCGRPQVTYDPRCPDCQPLWLTSSRR
jgi:hypothetical protein